jgi:hypothetical protein
MYNDYMKTPSQAKDEVLTDEELEARRTKNREAAARYRERKSAEGVTTIPKGSTAKRPEARSPGNG